MLTAFIISEWVLRVAMAGLILLRKRGPTALAWLLVSLAEPIVGLALYVLVGESHLARARSRQYEQALRRVDAAARLARQKDGTGGVPPERRNLAHLAERLGDMPTIPGNTAEIIAEPDRFFESLVADIDGAQSFVHLLYYIYNPGRAASAVSDALIRACARGVACRVLVDAVGSRNVRSLLPELRAAGVRIEEMLPANPVRRKLARVDLRNHRKLAIIDGRTMYTGSQNITDPVPPGPDRRPRSWRRRRKRGWDDLSVRLQGPVVLEGEVVFIEDWNMTTGEVLDELNPGEVRPPEPQGDTTAQIVPSGPTLPVDAFHLFIIGAFHDAARSIEVVNPYFVPDDTVVLALSIAAMRGVDVRLILPHASDHPLVNGAARSRFAELLGAGVRIYLHQGEMLHSKSIAIDDDLSIIGSGNIDMRSFHLNFELSMVLYGRQVTADLRAQHAKYIRQASEVTLDQWSKRGWFAKVGSNVAGLLGPLL